MAKPTKSDVYDTILALADEITYQCVHCKTQIHPYHVDPMNGLQYEGDNTSAGATHTLERCRDAVKEALRQAMQTLQLYADIKYHGEVDAARETLTKLGYNSSSESLLEE